MGYQFTLTLSRTITDSESKVLHEAGCDSVTVTTALVPPNRDITVTRLDFDTEGPSLEAAITSGMEAVKTVPDLTIVELEVPAQPDGTSSAADPRDRVLEGTVVEA
jgi:hypothetical protein